MKQRIFSLSPVATLAIAMCLQSGCQSEPETQSTPLLAEAKQGETNFSPYAPKNPYKEAGKNLLTRTVLETEGPGGVKIELRDLFVVPGTTAEKVSLPGPAVLEVLSGEGKITTGDKSQDLASGATVTLAQDASCALESRGITPLILRARIFIP